ncbi:MAG: DUF1289 domain-containing protein [Gammaproteobacteria bacterium]|nr:DUF1289 domain-containing protein [Gammaproteobacteria bacterium]
MRQTPCIGICSTTYGDLICRGCKRFAHEVTGWNGYADGQRIAVWRRLKDLRDAAVAEYVLIDNEAVLFEAAASLKIAPAPDWSGLSAAYEILRRIRGRPDLASLGLARSSFAAGIAAEELFGAIDREFYARATAAYERNFRILAQ